MEHGLCSHNCCWCNDTKVTPKGPCKCADLTIQEAEAIDPEITWRDMFIKYVELVGDYEGTSFLYERDWTPEEWERIEGAVF